MGRMPVPARVSALPQKGCPSRGTCRITRRFHRLYGWQGWVAYALRTRPPLSGLPKEAFPLDLHVLGLPPAFVLSQDQTLRCTIDFLISLFSVLGSASPLGSLSAAAHPSRETRRLLCWPQAFKELATPSSLRTPLPWGKRVQRYNLFHYPQALFSTFFRKITHLGDLQ